MIQRKAKINTNTKVSLVNNNIHTKKPMITERTEPGLVAFYDIRPGNGVGLFLQPRSLHGAVLTTDQQLLLS